MLGHKASFNKFKKIEIMPGIFSNHIIMRLKINYKKKTRKNTNTWRLNNILLNNKWVNENIKEEIKNALRQVKMETQLSQICGTQQKQF